jgi:cation transport regulator ChaB
MDGDNLMPYDTLPSRYRDMIPAKAGQDIFRNTVNSTLAAGKSEEVAFASAWAALQRAGYERNEDGKWVEKTQPASVHTPGTDWETQKAEYQGRKVTLDKPFRLPAGSGKKFGVYVKDGDKVKRVTFGDPNMEIRRDDPKARANFRSRHSCDTATDKTSARYWSCRMWTARNTVRDVAKRMLNDDTFTMREEAMARSYDLGLDGTIHVHETADGMATFMPGESHEAYLEHMSERAGLYEMEDMDEGYDEDDLEEESDENESDGLLERVISAILQAVIKDGKMTDTVTKASDILKVDRARRIVWGWASVSTLKGELVVDRQGDRIAPSEMEKMADAFMRSTRAAKAMHEGEDVGEVIHSLPLTKDLAEALGIDTDREGWITGTYVADDGEWAKVLRGDYAGFSIGGTARRKPT